MRDLILEKLDEIRVLIEKATCDGMPLSEAEDVYSELTGGVNWLVEAVEYYID